LEHEDPYTHLSTFYELTATMGFEDQDKEAVYMRLFPFSLAGKAKDWLKSHPNQSLTRWSDDQRFQISDMDWMKRYVQHGRDARRC